MVAEESQTFLEPADVQRMAAVRSVCLLTENYAGAAGSQGQHGQFKIL